MSLETQTLTVPSKIERNFPSYLSNEREVKFYHEKCSFLWNKKIEKILNDDFSGVVKCVNSFREVIKSGSWSEIETVISDIIRLLLEQSQQRANRASSHIKKRQIRQLFVSLGGFDLILKLFSPPLCPVDAQKLTKPQLLERTDVWNEALVVVRELLSSFSTLTSQYFDDQQIVFLFTMLRFNSIFENTMNVLEEILADKHDSFSLALIPDLYGLINQFSSRQFGHFCRALSLVVFEPEDRQIIEGSHVVRSLELLKLRRTRMARSGQSIIEKNQGLVSNLLVF
jgi:hypothetical protein